MTPGRTVEMNSAWPGSTPKSPSPPGTTTIPTASESSSFSGETSSNCSLSAIGSARLARHLARLLDRFLDRADHVEGALRQIVMLAGDDALEAFDRVLE